MAKNFTKRQKTIPNKKTIPNANTLYQMARKIDQYFLSYDPQKFTQSGNFGFKIYHLSTLLRSMGFQSIKLNFVHI
jgi:hypothetical protein